MEIDILKLAERAKQEIPSVNEILEEATQNLNINSLDKEQILNNFGNYVKDLEDEAKNIYLHYENLAFEKLLGLFNHEKRSYTYDEVKILINAARRLEFVAGQMRKARGGANFQKLLQKLLNYSGVPCETPTKEIKKQLKRIDLVCPSADIAIKKPDKAIFLAVKRTLRERWKQVVPEQMKGARLYVVTINGTCPEGKAHEINEAGLIAYVPEALKSQKHLVDKSWIRPLSELPKDVK